MGKLIQFPDRNDVREPAVLAPAALAKVIPFPMDGNPAPGVSLSAVKMADMLPVQGPYPPYEILGWVDEPYARELIRDRKVYVFHTKTHIRALRYIANQCSAGEIEQRVAVHAPGLGDPHRRETDINPPGVWTFDKLPRWSQKLFTRVVDSCKKAA